MEDEILSIKALSEEEIIKNNYSLNQLWMISFKEKVQGPFLESQLKKLFIENKELKNNNFQFCNLEKEKWVSFEDTHFVGTNKCYLVVNNDQQFTFDNIVTLVQEKKIDEQILISSDQGSSYNSLRSLQEFQFLFSRTPKLPDMISKEQFFHDKTLQIKINQKKMNSSLVENLMNSSNTLTSQIKNVKLPKNNSNIYILSIIFFVFSAALSFKFLNTKQKINPINKINAVVEKEKNEAPRTIASLPTEQNNVATPPPTIKTEIKVARIEHGIDGDVLQEEKVVSAKIQESVSPQQPIANPMNQQSTSKKGNTEVEKNEIELEDNEEE